MKRRVSVFVLAIGITLGTGNVHAAMRCGSQLINEGDPTSWVALKCGEPDKREVIEPSGVSNNPNLSKGATVENWVYGPDNGAYRYLKFIDGKLVKIEFRR